MRASLLLILATACVPRLESEGEPPVVSDWTLPENGWESTEAPPATLVAEGFATGEVPPDIRLPDQFGATVSLWQFYGEVVVLDVSTIWCGPCQELAVTTEEVAQEYASRGLRYVTVIQQDLEGDVPGVDDAELWANEFGITSPVLADTAEPPATAGAVPDNVFPGLVLIGRDMRVIEKIYPTDDATLRAAIEDAL